MTTTETTWLIRHPSKPNVYFGWIEGHSGWTAETNHAIHSETEKEAEQFASDIGLADWTVVQAE